MGTHEGNLVGERTEEDAQTALELDVLDTDLRDHLAVELNVALAIPVDIKVHLDRAAGHLVDVHVAELERDAAKVNLGKVERVEGRRQHAREHGLDNRLGHVGAQDANVGPQLGHDVVEEA